MGPPSSATWAAEVRRARSIQGPSGRVRRRLSRRQAAGVRPSRAAPRWRGPLGRVLRRAPPPRPPARCRLAAARDAPARPVPRPRSPAGAPGARQAWAQPSRPAVDERLQPVPLGLSRLVWHGPSQQSLHGCPSPAWLGPRRLPALRRSVALRPGGRRGAGDGCWGGSPARPDCLPRDRWIAVVRWSADAGGTCRLRWEESCVAIIAHKDKRRRSVSIGSTFGCKVARLRCGRTGQVLGASGRVASGATGRAGQDNFEKTLNGNGNRCQ
jgi:hypothetical protein